MVSFLFFFKNKKIKQIAGQVLFYENDYYASKKKKNTGHLTSVFIILKIASAYAAEAFLGSIFFIKFTNPKTISPNNKPITNSFIIAGRLILGDK